MGIIQGLRRRLWTIAPAFTNPDYLRRGGSFFVLRELNQPWLRARGFRTVIDIGANTGHFALVMGILLPGTQLYAFEPLPDCFDQLQKRMAATPNFRAFNLALGDCTGELTFEQNTFSPSSSFLRINEVHKTLFPSTRNVHPITVRIARLDDIVTDLKLVPPVLIKIDVQGFEDRVLAGGEQTIRQADILIIETSFEMLYEGQVLFDDLYRTLYSWDFHYAGAISALPSPLDRHLIQEDSLFIKNGR